MARRIPQGSADRTARSRLKGEPVLLDTDRTILWQQVGFRPGIMGEVARIIRELRER
jgi:hypothetical protein